jgi:hypothetical protein
LKKKRIDRKNSLTCNSSKEAVGVQAICGGHGGRRGRLQQTHSNSVGDHQQKGVGKVVHLGRSKGVMLLVFSTCEVVHAQ